MDGELERLYPQEAQEIGKKIQGSKFATDLFHKVRDVMRRLRLAAPSVTERGANLDCNTVAEYLDNELPDDRVPDFEEVCLKSEMHLAEVASCHQILAIAQVEPAEVAPESRQRMYQLPLIANRVDEERLAASEAATVLSGDGVSAAGSPAAPVKVRPRPVVPEYLRDPPRKRRLLPAAAITLLLGAVAGLALAMTGQFNKGTPLGDYLDRTLARFSGKAVAKKEIGKGDRPAKNPAPADAASPSDNAPSSGAASAASSGAGVKPSAAAAVNAAAPSAAAPSGDTAAPPIAGTTSPREQPLPLPDFVPPKPEQGPDGAGLPAPPPEAPGTIAPPPEATPMPTAPSAAGANPAIVPAPPPTAEIKPVSPPRARVVPPVAEGAAPPGTGEIARTNPLPPATERKAKIARFTSDGQDVLLKYDDANSFWRRVLPEEFLTTSQRLLALPCYRSRIDVLDATASARIELFNGTRIELLPSGPRTPLGVAVDFGRLIVKPLAQSGARLRLVAGAHDGTLTLANDESVAAVEVARVHEPGTDPEKVLSHPLTKLYVARGSATWEEGDKPPVQLIAPGESLLDGKAEPRPANEHPAAAAEVPKWVTANTISDYDQRAAVSVAQGVPAERSASMSLMELTEDRKIEVKNLAARCLGYLGQFDPVMVALNDTKALGSWPDYLQELKEAIARGPETAAAIRGSLDSKFSDDAGELYRMLWGYTDKDLEGGEDAKLVKYLDHESPIFRVLAFYNLNEITGKGYYYSPQVEVAAKRQQSVQLFKQDLLAGKIRHSPPAAPKPRPASGRSAAPPSPPATERTPEPAPGPAPEPPDFPAGEDTTSVRPTGAQEPVAAAGGRFDSARQPRPRLAYPEPGQ